MITELLNQYHLSGLAVGLATFLIIGIFHPIVIKAEYYFGVRSWWAFLVGGIAACVLSMFLTDTTLSILAGVVAFSCFWSIGEVFEQKKRVDRGWFPPGPGHGDAEAKKS